VLDEFAPLILQDTLFEEIEEELKGLGAEDPQAEFIKGLLYQAPKK
jgi:hypothetical protein